MVHVSMFFFYMLALFAWLHRERGRGVSPSSPPSLPFHQNNNPPQNRQLTFTTSMKEGCVEVFAALGAAAFLAGAAALVVDMFVYICKSFLLEKVVVVVMIRVDGSEVKLYACLDCHL